jgi:TetR/AcrR family transcriptional repressor of nem operon
MVAYRPIGQMPPRQDTRKRLVETALKLFASRGYYHTSIADILRESGCKRGVLYYYFSSKEELGYAAIDEQLRLLAELGAASHLRTNVHPIDRLLRVVDALPHVSMLKATGSTATHLAVRMASVHEGFRRHLAGILEAAVEQVEEVVRRGVAEGQIVDSVDPDQLAHMIATLGAGVQLGSLLWEREAIWEDARLWLKEYLNSLRK